MTYSPTPVQQTSYTAPADGGVKDAASVDVMLKALADGLAASSTIPFNWQKSSATTHNLKRGAWQAIDQAWWGVGDGGNDFLEASLDGGRSWKDHAADLGSALVCIDVAFSSAGVGLVVTGAAGKDVYTGAHTSYGVNAWTHHAGVLTAQMSGGLVDRDDVNGVFLVCYRTGAAGMHIDSSPAGVVFTAAALPAGWTGYAGAINPAIGCNASGHSIAWFYDGAVFRVLRSSDGLNWAETTIVPAISLASLTATGIFSQPVYDPVYGLWYIAASTTTGTRQSEVWKSADNGANWTKAIGPSANDMVIQDLAVIAGVLLAVGDSGRIFYSADVGTTWKLAGCNPIASAARPGLRAANGQALVWNSADKTTFGSHRYGAAGV